MIADGEHFRQRAPRWANTDVRALRQIWVSGRQRSGAASRSGARAAHVAPVCLQIVRKAASAVLAVKADGEAVEEAQTAALGLVTKADIRGWFKHCGYSLAHE